MRVYSEESNKGRRVSIDDIHHKTYDSGEGYRKAAAKAQRKAARRVALYLIMQSELRDKDV